MKIEKLVLHHYKRLMLNNIREFEWTPKAKILLLLGNNGSGKSSLLEELTPCPAHHSAFTSGGLKEFHCSHNNQQYVLKSVYNGGSGQHSFIRGGVEELNPGGTFAVQKDLVLKVFGLDRNIHEVLIGQSPFTAMPTNKRREWLTRLSPIDLTYVFSQYNTVKAQKRDAQGVIKHQAKRLSSEHFDLPNDAELHGYREQVKTMSARLQELYRTRGSQPAGIVSNQDYALQYSALRSKVKHRLEKQPNVIELHGLKSKREAYDQAAMAGQALTAVGQSLQQTAIELEEIQERKAPLLAAASPEKIQGLKEELERCQHTIAEQQACVQAYTAPFPLVTHEVFPHSLGLLQEMASGWLELLQSFPNNPDNVFNHQAGVDARQQYAQTNSRIAALTDRHSMATQRLAQLRGCDDIVCPACTHSFKPGIAPSDIQQQEIVCAKLGETMEALEKEQVHRKEYIEGFDDYMVFVNRFRVLVRQYDVYKPLWDHCVEQRVMFTTPRVHVTDALQWQTAQRAYIVLTEAQQRVIQIQEQLDRYASLDVGDTNYLIQRQTVLEEQVTHLYDQRASLQANVRALNQGLKHVEDYELELQSLQQDVEGYLAGVSQQIQSLIHRGFDEEIKHTSAQLTELQSTLHRFDLREHTMRDIERDHREAVEWHADLALLEKALSPTDGLIGQYLMGFMQNIVKLMNAVISEIWTYPMEVLPSKVERDELDYNFPLNVNNGAVVAPDIARGSSSQRDIVNFAFKLIFMKFLGLEDFPLYLDEFGNTFDEQHRLNLIPFLNRLVELNQVSQIIYISHFSSTHGAFNHAEVVVLDATNITAPSSYNQTVRMA